MILHKIYTAYCHFLLHGSVRVRLLHPLQASRWAGRHPRRICYPCGHAPATPLHAFGTKKCFKDDLQTCQESDTQEQIQKSRLIESVTIADDERLQLITKHRSRTSSLNKIHRNQLKKSHLCPITTNCIMKNSTIAPQNLLLQYIHSP